MTMERPALEALLKAIQDYESLFGAGTEKAIVCKAESGGFYAELLTLGPTVNAMTTDDLIRFGTKYELARNIKTEFDPMDHWPIFWAGEDETDSSVMCLVLVDLDDFKAVTDTPIKTTFRASVAA
jgi:hypothetical protein